MDSNMNKVNELSAVLMGTLTSTTIGAFVFEAMGTLLLGILGALGGWVFHKWMKPWLEEKFGAKKGEKA